MHRPALSLLVALAIAVGTLTVAEARVVKLKVRAGKVNKGDETQLCHPVEFPRNEDTMVNRIQIKVRGGSHHVHLYRPYPGLPDYPTYDCPFAIDFSKWQLVVATQNPLLDWQLPPGVGINFLARQPLMIQTHFVNAGSLKVKGRPRAKMLLHTMKPETVTAYGGALFAQDRTVLVPPGRSTVISRCTLTGEGDKARPMTIMALTGHYHFRGVNFQVYRTNADSSLGELLYNHDGYDDPTFKEFPPESPLVLEPGEGIEWWCTYQNNTSETFKFGPNTSRNEHCNLFGFYYPSHAPQEAMNCIRYVPKDSDHDVTVRCGVDGVPCP